MTKNTSFCGEFDVEDNYFECIVDRFIKKGGSVSSQFSGFDSEGGKFSATGAALKDPLGRFVTSDFRLRYDSDQSDTPARFQIHAADYIEAAQALAVNATWIEDGESYSLTGKLKRFDC